MDLTAMFVEVWSGILDPVYSFLRTAFFLLLFCVLAFIGLFVYKVLPSLKPILKTGRIDGGAIADALGRVRLRFLPYDLTRWLIVDYLRKQATQHEFKEFGITFYVGRQGGGKTASMVKYMRAMRTRYPKLLIVSNLETRYTDVSMKGWSDFVEIRNGTDGVLFCIDEIQAEYSTRSSKDFPDELLRHICMQRKQRVKIVCTAQYFSRVAKPLREQANDVVVCSSFMGRLVKQVAYDAVLYEAYSGGLPVKMEKKSKLWREYYVMGDNHRESYDTYKFVDRLQSFDYKDKVCNDYQL